MFPKCKTYNISHNFSLGVFSAGMAFRNQEKPVSLCDAPIQNKVHTVHTPLHLTHCPPRLTGFLTKETEPNLSVLSDYFHHRQ